MPEVNRLQVEPARKAIRELYLVRLPGPGIERSAAGRAGYAHPLAVMQAGELIGKIPVKR